MPTDHSGREARALARRTWPGKLVELGAEDPAQLDTADARLATMWTLAQTAWAMAGRALPVYDRASMPGRLIRLEDDE